MVSLEKGPELMEMAETGIALWLVQQDGVAADDNNNSEGAQYQSLTTGFESVARKAVPNPENAPTFCKTALHVLRRAVTAIGCLGERARIRGIRRRTNIPCRAWRTQFPRCTDLSTVYRIAQQMNFQKQ